MARPTTTAPTSRPRDATEWERRCGALYEDLRRPAAAMVRRAFGRAFGDDEIDDLYGAAWLGTLRALDRRRTELDDDALRRYVMTAVANQASKELRRRGRRPTARLDEAWELADAAPGPAERATGREQSRIARDVLGTLPPRRRAVILLRYGWGLEPREVCGVVTGLSPRAYRREITRGVDELSAKLAEVEAGTWCESQERILRAYAAGDADAEQRRRAQRHLAHCRPCAEYVGELRAHLHELGAAVAWTGAGGALGGDRLPFANRIGELSERARESVAVILGRGGEPADAAAGLGAAGVAKLAGAGAAQKLVAACIGTGAAATACVVAGIGPVQPPEDRTVIKPDRPVAERDIDGRSRPATAAPSSAPTEEVGEASPPDEDPVEPVSPPAPEPAPAPAVEPVEQEFGLAAAPSASGSSGSPSDAGAREFGP